MDAYARQRDTTDQQQHDLFNEKKKVSSHFMALCAAYEVC